MAREVGTEGKLGGQARVEGVAGVWRDLTENVNAMAGNLTVQLRDVSAVATAIANGDLTRKITVDVKGEILQIKDVINSMVDQLRVFADEVTRVAREVGTEGKLGGQAEVPGAAGTWRALTENVNAMANSLTAQVRAIKDVATAVTEGDLTRTITVDAKGELDELKRSVNQMISNLKETTERNEEQDWLKTNLAKFSRMMQGQRDLESVSRLIMSDLTPLVGAHHGAFFLADGDGNGNGNGGGSDDAAAPDRQLRVQGAQERQRTGSGRARGWWARRRWRRSRSCSPGCPTTTSASPAGWARRRRATSWCCPSSSRATSRP